MWFSDTDIKNWYPELMFSMVKFPLNCNKAAVISQHGVMLSVPDSLSRAMGKKKTQKNNTVLTSQKDTD